jgi:predicted dehydrogenase
MSNVKVGVVGTGHLGNLHTKFFSQANNCELIGIFDKNIETAKTVAETHGTKVFDNLQNLLKETDAVSIVATTSAHYEIAKLALENGNHVMIEKPITTTLEEAQELIDLAKSKNLKIQVGHIERFNPALVSLEKYNLDPMFVQTDRLAQFNPRGTDVAVVLDLMIHDIDIILSLIKSKVKNISASGVAVVSDNLDIANARLEFENGAVANVTASRISLKKMRKMRMFQRDAYISLDFGTGVSEVFRLEEPGVELPDYAISYGEIGVSDKKKTIVFEKPENIELNALQHEIQLFVDCVKNGTEPIVTGQDGLRALRVAQIIIQKIKENNIS